MRDADRVSVQADIAPAAVEEQSQVSVACTVTNQAAAAPRAVPLVVAGRAHTRQKSRRALTMPASGGQ